MPQQAAYLDDNGNPIYLDDNGNIVKGSQEIKPAPLTASGEKGFLSKAYNAIFEAPEFITKGAQDISQRLTEHSLDESMLGSQLRGFLGGATEGAASLLSPANIITLGRSRLASVAAKALGIGQGIHGIDELAEGNPMSGALDISLGGLNMLTGGKSPLRSRLNTIIKDSEAMRKSPLPIPKQEMAPTDIIASQPIRPQFNPKGQKGMTGSAQRMGADMVDTTTGEVLNDAGELIDPYTEAKRNLDTMHAMGQVVDYEDELDNLNRQYGVIDTMSKELDEQVSATKNALDSGYIVLNKNSPHAARMKREGYTLAGKQGDDLVLDYPVGNPHRKGVPYTPPQSLGQRLLNNETGAINIESAPEGARNIKLKQPTMELIHALGKRGYVPGGVGPDGIPFMTYKGKPIPLEDLPIPPEKKASVMQELYNLPRGLTTSWDISAPLRQGLPLITKKEWWKAWPDMMKSMGSQRAYDMVMANIEARPLFAHKTEPAFVGGKWVNKRIPSLAEKSGLAMTDLKSFGSREENIMSSWAEAVPGIRPSNRAYTAFLNKLRADTFESLIKDADAVNNPELAKEIADFVNTATGRGPLRTSLPNITRGGVGLKERSLEQAASVLTNTLFSPRLVASRVRMLNPATYIAASPFVRKQYMKAFLSTAGAWGTVASLAKMAGADVVLDANNADFGKIKIGNTRLDPAAGFQQYLVLAHRLISGKTTSSTSSRTQELGKGFRAPTRRSVVEDFGANKLHPTLKFAYDLYDASKYKSVMLGDRLLQMFVPLIVQDIAELAQEDPSLLPLAIPTAMGMGTQTYEKGKQESVLLPEEFDIKYQGGSPF